MDLKYIIAQGLIIIQNLPALNICDVDKMDKVCSRSELFRYSIGRYTYIRYQILW